MNPQEPPRWLLDGGCSEVSRGSSVYTTEIGKLQVPLSTALCLPLSVTGTPGTQGPASPFVVKASTASLLQTLHLLSPHSGPWGFSLTALKHQLSDHATATLNFFCSLRVKCRPGGLTLRPYLAGTVCLSLDCPPLRPSRKPSSSGKSSWCPGRRASFSPGLHMLCCPGAHAGCFHQTQGLEGRWGFWERDARPTAGRACAPECEW